MTKLNTLDFDTQLTPKIAELFAMLTETRARLKEQIKDMTQDELDFSPSMTKIETIGTLLFHIAAIEFSWIYEDIFGEEMKYEEWKYALALRENLDPPQLTGKELSFYIIKLDNLRKKVYHTLQEWKDEALERIIKSNDNKYTIYWILYHLNQHESVHIGQINFLRRIYRLVNS